MGRNEHLLSNLENSCVQVPRMTVLLSFSQIFRCCDLFDQLLFGVFSCPFVLQSGIALPHSAQPSVPDSEKGLAEVGLDTPTLVMNIVVRGIVASDMLEGIPGQCVSAVVVYCLHGAADIEQNGHARRHHADFVGQSCARGVQNETLHRMVVKSAVRIWNVEAVVTSMPVRCKMDRSQWT